jgi:hypothetical protein
VDDRVTLNDGVGLSLGKLTEIVGIKLDTTSPDYLKLMSIQKDAAVALLNTAVKVDETRLKARAENSLNRLLDKINQRRLTA